jgi:hypothetical protein
MATKKSTKKSSKGKATLKLDRLSANQLNTASKTFFRAAQQGSIKELAAVVSPDFRFIDEKGQMLRAAACTASIEETVSNPDPTKKTFAKEKIKVNSFNVKSANTQKIGDVVIETMLYSDNVTVQPRNQKKTVTFDRNFRWTNIWAQSDGGFKLMLTQLTPAYKE